MRFPARGANLSFRRQRRAPTLSFGLVRLKGFQLHIRDTIFAHAQDASRRGGQVNNTVLNIWSAVIDRYLHCSPSVQICHVDNGAESQSTMRRCEVTGVKLLTVRRCATVLCSAVEGCKPSLGKERSIGRRLQGWWRQVGRQGNRHWRLCRATS